MANQLLLTIQTSDPAQTGTRLADYAQLTRSQLTVMALLTVAAGAVLASGGAPDWRTVTHAVFGAALVAAGASAVNQWLERETDARMRRTQDRPLPAGRLQPGKVLVLGLGSAAAGVVYPAVTLRHPPAAAVAALTFRSYGFVYTPITRRTPLNTLVGAIPGALPPVIGWTAVRGLVSAKTTALFAILFLWQVPHVLAIAWIHRVDYGRAGLRMLPSVDSEGSMTGRQMIGFCLALVLAGAIPLVVGGAGLVYRAGALLLGAGFPAHAVGSCLRRSLARARAVLRVSSIHLPALRTPLVRGGIPPGRNLPSKE